MYGNGLSVVRNSDAVSIPSNLMSIRGYCECRLVQIASRNNRPTVLPGRRKLVSDMGSVAELQEQFGMEGVLAFDEPHAGR